MNKEGPIREWITEEHIDVAVLTETLQNPNDKIPQWISECAPVQRPRQSNRRRGGVAVAIAPHIQYKTIVCIAGETFQMVIVNVGTTNICGLYISPSEIAENVHEIMDIVAQRTTGRTIVIGDLNARNTAWDIRSNGRGSALRKWATKKGWKIRAPSTPTHFPAPTKRASPSVIDLVVTRNVETSLPIVCQGTWGGTSDHEPVKIELRNTNQTIEVNARPRRISHARRIDPNTLDKAGQWYETEMPRLTRDVKDCKSVKDLEALLDKLADIILQPWNGSNKWTGRPPNPGWSYSLRRKAKLRSKLYKQAQRTGDIGKWEQYRSIDKEIKREVRKTRMRRRASEMEQVVALPAREAISLFAKQARQRQKDANAIETTKGALDMDKFLKHIATEEGVGHTPELQKFKTLEQMQQRIKKAIGDTPNGKSEGADGVFVEALKTAPNLMSKMIAEVWRKCGELCHMPRQWRTAIVVPIHKKGDMADPANYRPISIISQLRKIVDKAIDTQLREEYEFRPAQVGFRAEMSTETAIMRTSQLRAMGMKYTAILDLKKAYDNVPRDKLMQIVEERIPLELAKQIAYLLQPMQIKSRDNQECQPEDIIISKGVPQGDPPSTTLFNMYMDTYIDHILGTTDKYFNATTGIVVFADDVIILTKDAQSMRTALDKSTRWAEHKGMQWSAHKCEALADENEEQEFRIAGEKIKNVQETMYLGFTITAAGITGRGTIERCARAIRCTETLKGLGVSVNKLGTNRVLRICAALVTPITEYAIHITPPDEEVKQAFEKVQMRVISMAINRVPPASAARARKSCGMLPYTMRAANLWHKMERRIAQRIERASNSPLRKYIAEQDAQAAKVHQNRHHIPAGVSNDEVWRFRSALCATAARKIPMDGPRVVLPITKSANHLVSKNGVRWYLNLFPLQNRKMNEPEHREMRRGQDYMEAMKTLKKEMPKKNSQTSSWQRLRTLSRRLQE